ncbi:MAG: hypothetical protein IBX61_03380 [Thermoleophilia bacterium]|nr:hypothetical protein [Thermoleophilia bacterium]
MTNLFERSFLIALGAAALTREMAADIVDELANKGDVASAEGRKMVEDTIEQAKVEARGMKTRFDEGLKRSFTDMGLATSDQIEELTLKLAQIEHRLSLLEASAPTAAPGIEPVVTAEEMPSGEMPEEVSEEHHRRREERAEAEGLNPHLDLP